MIIREVTEMAVWKLKSCPRCGGDLYIDRDPDGWFSHCLQCSEWRELSSPVAAHEPPVAATARTKTDLPIH